MQQPVSVGNYKRKASTLKDILETYCLGTFDIFVEVDLEYLPQLHASHNASLLAQEKQAMMKDWLSACACSFILPVSQTPNFLKHYLIYISIPGTFETLIFV